ncbi:MAG: 2-C-methyl-D-erythritol 2,4-cyclodiphosphate synthase [Spirochaetaceae bacterium 4572_59]|nr:MAG: 2-C-methyl-D-erythritol 2,4-cyclodiphosphate synthase [Spirochaetaceae bacterium 4572_59]
MRIGQGYDIHRLSEGRPLVLGGITVPFEKGEDGHSDGDVLIHAVIDALLGALADGDIGTHYPPSDPKWKGISSRILLKETAERVRRAGYRIANLDSTVILEKPKLLLYKDAIRQTLAEDLGIPENCVAVKAKTKEKQDACGQGLAIEAMAAVLLLSQDS